MTTKDFLIYATVFLVGGGLGYLLAVMIAKKADEGTSGNAPAPAPSTGSTGSTGN